MSGMSLTCHENGSPGARSDRGGRGPSLLSGGYYAGPWYRMIDPHNGECICSRASQTGLKHSVGSHQTNTIHQRTLIHSIYSFYCIGYTIVLIPDSF